MSAANSLSKSVRGVGRNALDLPVAALAGLAVAFVSFAMPADLLAELVASSGLPSLLPAAEPPLGMKARIAVGAAGAATVFVLVFLLLRLIDRSGLGRNTPAEIEEEEEAPRVRRRDFHPDAPAPRPISAARDFGEPEWTQPKVEDAPLWLSPAEEVSAEAPEEIEEAEFSESEPVEYAAESEALPEPEAWQEPEPLPEPQSFPQPAAWEEPEALPERGPEPEPEPVRRNEAQAPATIAELMERLEQGLARRQVLREPFASTPSATRSPVEPQPAREPADDRLQSAIDSLQRLAARQS